MSDLITVLRVAVPIRLRVVKIFYRVLTGSTGEKNDQIKQAEISVEEYFDEDADRLRKIKETRYGTYKCTEKDFEALFEDKSEKKENDEFFKLGGNDGMP